VSLIWQQMQGWDIHLLPAYAQQERGLMCGSTDALKWQ
jgi:hypothetical protein